MWCDLRNYTNPLYFLLNRIYLPHNFTLFRMCRLSCLLDICKLVRNAGEYNEDDDDDDVTVYSPVVLIYTNLSKCYKNQKNQLYPKLQAACRVTVAYGILKMFRNTFICEIVNQIWASESETSKSKFSVSRYWQLKFSKCTQLPCLDSLVVFMSKTTSGS